MIEGKLWHAKRDDGSRRMHPSERKIYLARMSSRRVVKDASPGVGGLELVNSKKGKRWAHDKNPEVVKDVV